MINFLCKSHYSRDFMSMTKKNFSISFIFLTEEWPENWYLLVDFHVLVSPQIFWHLFLNEQWEMLSAVSFNYRNFRRISNDIFTKLSKGNADHHYRTHSDDFVVVFLHNIKYEFVARSLFLSSAYLIMNITKKNKKNTLVNQSYNQQS